MRILAWNILQGGGKRAEKIIQNILDHKPDVVILTEYTQGRPGDRIREGLKAAGFNYQYATAERPRINAVLVASRIPYRVSRTLNELGENTHRICEVKFHDLTLLACLFPQQYKKIPVFEFVVEWAKQNREKPAMIVGDLNTGKHFTDEPGKTFVGAKYFDTFEDAGFWDAWRLFHGKKREYTWFSNVGNGFRIDHAFANKLAKQRLLDVKYSHTERETRVSDHSVLLLNLDERCVASTEDFCLT